MLWIKLKPEESIDVKDEQGNHLGVLKAEQRGGSVRIGFDGVKRIRLNRRAAGEPQSPELTVSPERTT